MQKNNDRLEKVSASQNPKQNGDWIAVLVTIALLFAIISSSPQSNQPTNTPDTTKTKQKTNVIDTMHVEQGVFVFDSLELIKKIKENIK